MTELKDSLFSFPQGNFEKVALELFRFQFDNVPVYREFCLQLKRTPKEVNELREIPFLPIEFFKSREVIASNLTVQRVFESSGTTGSVSSKHLVADLELYEQIFVKGFELAYGNVSDYTFLCLLPSYLERGNSSLIYMAEKLVQLSGHAESGFYLMADAKLLSTLKKLQEQKRKTILLGVTFALLDFAEQHQINFPELIVMETGGMKGRREEKTRKEIHQILCSAFGVSSIHSEYGMTELLSQGYSKGKGIFHNPSWMKILVRDIYDPMNWMDDGKAGGINVIDLANLYSCSFIATGDLGVAHSDGGFEVLGRLDNAEIRGCNLMYTEG